MSTIDSTVKETFEAEGFDVAEVTENRGLIRVVLLTADADRDRLRSLADSAVADGRIVGFNVASESTEGSEEIATVVSFRYRS